MYNKDDKIQIVAFSTNDSTHTPLDIMNSFLERQNHIILKKNRNSIAFTTSLDESSNKENKVMICAVLNLHREYTGINDVNCYIIFVDLQDRESIDKFDSIINYSKEYCDLTKKIFIFGMTYKVESGEDNEGDRAEKVVTKDDITKTLANSEINYEYNEINISNNQEIFDQMKNILIFSERHSIAGDILEDKDENSKSSCIII